MPEPKTAYDPNSYNPNSFRNIMQFIFADLMIRFDREGEEDFWLTNKEVRAMRKAIEAAYRSQITKPKRKQVAIQHVAEAVLLWLRDSAGVDEVTGASKKELLKIGRLVQDRRAKAEQSGV